MEGSYLSWVNRKKSRGLLWVTLLFLLGGCGVVPNSQERNGEEEKEINKAFRGNEAASASCEQTNVKLDKVVRQVAQATKARQAHPSEEFEEAQRGGVQGPFLFTRSNTASPFVTRPEENDPQLSLSGEEEDVSTPQEILDRKFRHPEVVLTPSQSITLLNHCTELGEKNAETATAKTVSIFLGNTGAGKSTTINALLGCQMRAVRPRELGLPGMKRVVVVAPESPREEVMPIGHGGQSQTFLPQVVQTPDEPSSAYCDCPGFYDTRGAEINIANAINIRKVLQQATGVKAVFLTHYKGLTTNRGRCIRDLEAMCGKMFGGVDNLRKYQNSVLLGITKAPLYEEDELLTTNVVRGQLLMGVNSDVATILANRIFLFDPLDRAIDNPDFWPIERFRTEIAQLEHIPQQQAIHLFQTTLTDREKVHLSTTVRQLQPRIVSAIEQGDVTALGQHWQLLQRLRVVEHSEADQLIEGQVFPAINYVILQRVDAINSSAGVLNFDDVRRKLSELASIISHLPGVPLACDINAIQKHIHDCEANKDNEDARQENLATLRAELAEAHKRLALVREQLDRTSNEQ